VSKSYLDYSFTGELNTSGEIVEYRGSEAVANAVRAWLMSFQGEVLRKPSLGGVLIPFLIKPMSEEVAVSISNKIVEGLRSEFVPRVIVKSITVIPDFECDCYDLRIKGYCPSVRDTLEINESINKILI